MGSTCEEQGSERSQKRSRSGIGVSNSAGDFECNICLELAQDPVVTLCGHLFCWPCLHRWLRLHAHSLECPVCKALVQEHELIPLHRRGRSPADPRAKPVPGVDIPDRPGGSRPETSPSFSHHGIGSTASPSALNAARMSNLGLVAAFGGFLPPVFCFHAYGVPAVMPHGSRSFDHGGYPYGYAPPGSATRRGENCLLSTMFLIVGAFVVFALMFT